MPPAIIAAIIAGAASVSAAGIGAGASASASKKQKKAASSAIAQSDKYYDIVKGYEQPIYDQGMKDYGTLGDMVRSGSFNMPASTYNAPSAPGVGQYQAPQYQQQGFNFQTDPSYQFRLKEGQGAIQNSAAAKGSLLSGATLKALARYGSNLASQEYANAYDRYQQDRTFDFGKYESNRNFGYNQFTDTRNFDQNRYLNDRNFGYAQFTDDYNRNLGETQNRYNRMASLANTGVGTANNLASLASAAGGTQTELQLQKGNVDAAGAIGTGQAVGNGVNNLGQIASYYYYNKPYTQQNYPQTDYNYQPTDTRNT